MNPSAAQEDAQLDHLGDIIQQKRIPRATYRIQFNADFTFEDARKIVPYLHALGISDLYASPLLQARPGSSHGYDTCDYSTLNDALGTNEEFDALINTLQEYDMGLLLDIVPNHMGVNVVCNTWWYNVLENGPSSLYAHYFDIDWYPVKVELANKVLLPILEDQYGTVLEDGKMSLEFIDGRFIIRYHEHELPLSPDTYVDILSDVEQTVQQQTEIDDVHLLELQSILTALRNLPSYTTTDPEQIAERSREKEIIKRRLDALVSESSIIRTGLDESLRNLNGEPGKSETYDRLDNLLQQQPYRMAFWRVAADEINYRRFFDINDMAAIHIEYPDVFEAVHEQVLQLLGKRSVTGLRVDHPDGLWNPTAYFQALQESYITARVQNEVANETETENVDQTIQISKESLQCHSKALTSMQPLYVVVEKILSETEPLPVDWDVDGTTGYDFLNVVNGLFVEPANETRMSEIYHQFIGSSIDFHDLVYNTKIMLMEGALASEIRSLSRQLERITEASRRYRDFTLSGITQAIQEVIASLSVYRTYITEQSEVSERDQYYVLEAVRNARRRNPNTSRLLFTFIRDTLLLHNLGDFSPAYQSQVVNFVMKFQQITGPVMAKSVEDTAFYIYNRLVSINEVGCHPDQFGLTINQFHKENQIRRDHWQHAMLSTSTHDTKRGEDVRTRISVLSEIPDEWARAVQTWAQLNMDKKTVVDELNVPDANDEFLYYQTLLGIWDESESKEDILKRLKAYLTKATNEAKVHTSWINPDEDYNEALHLFVEQTLENNAFLEAFLPLQQKVAYFGRLNSLSQSLLKLTAPGVPDIYQGSELWNLSLVDPDNRRKVDFDLRQNYLNDILDTVELSNLDTSKIDEMIQNGTIKLLLTAKVLRYRREHAVLFEQGSYEPVYIEGPWQEHVCAFLRRSGSQIALTVVPIRCTTVTGGSQTLPTGIDTWKDTRLILSTTLENISLKDIFTEQVIKTSSPVSIGNLFQKLPFALLVTDH